MTAASATPQQMKDRLLQAIDGQSNIRNMMAVLEVISYLEKYPITKEALEETRLGKLINDVRKKTKDEDLAKRAKKLLRTWQKLIEPEPNDPAPKEHTGTNGGAKEHTATNGGPFSSRIDYPPQAVTSVSGKTAPELKIRNDFHNCNYPKVEVSGHRKRKGGQRDAQQHLPSKISKTSAFEHHSIATPRPTNGIAASPDTRLNMFDNLHHQPDKDAIEGHDHDRPSKVPVNAVKPHPSSPAVSKPPSASLLLKTAVLQQQAKKDLPATGGVQHPPKSPCSPAVNPKSNTPDTLGRWPPPSGVKATITSPPSSPKVPSDRVSSGPPLQSPNPALQGSYPTETTRDWQADAAPGHSEGRSVVQPEAVPSLNLVTDAPDGGPPVEAATAKQEGDGAAHNNSERKRKKYRPRDYTVSLVGQQHSEDSKKPAKLKDRKLTFDPVTGQIKPLALKEAQPREDVLVTPVPTAPESHWTDVHKQDTCPPPPNPLQQTNWKELSRNEIIQSYLSLQSNVLTSSGTQTPGAHFFMTEFLKHEEHHTKEPRETHVLVPDPPALHLPGITRDVSKEDLSKLHTDRWPGVNGCYDTKDNWHDWTKCISLAPHGDDGKLHILPYVCLD
ncbi:mediator of RNA polymerase II transcription subunit 26-like [Alosa sapidissima]|uniref:mediator of RNA polymerase II transcription subunit 26-like n=1 Tax=Alosa sapidissima TaxID=34773 RepID=UPI001C08458B|nr:mediator of RNA polymerase II transcription subunit 26-like [Alosa sapidissima]